MNHEPYCAVCRRHVYPGDDHVTVDVKRRNVADRDEIDDYYLHIECANSVFDGWMEP